MAGTERIVFLGDSITQAGHYVADVQCGLLARGRDAEVLNLGLSSESATDLTDEENAPHATKHGFPRPLLGERLRRTLAHARPDVVVACYGMNDASALPVGPAGLERYAAAMTRLREAAFAAGAQEVVLCTPPVYDAGAGATGPDPRGRNIADFSAWLIGQRRVGWPVVDIHGPMRHELDERRKADPRFRFQKDGVHPQREGHWFMARQILGQYFGIDTEGLASAEDFFPQEGVARRRAVANRLHQQTMKNLQEIGHGNPRVPGGPTGPRNLPPGGEGK
ncbi:MAG: SGNH/GDSL hydrolase family protein [Chthoniobacterales bacterium]